MKYLYLIRHAQASWIDFHKSDLERSIDAESHSDCRKLNLWLEENKIKPEIIYHSPAQRIKETLALLPYWKSYPIKQINKIYQAAPSTLFMFLQKLNNDLSRVALVGHNPALTRLVHLLTNQIDFHMQAGTIIILKLDIEDWQEIDFGSGTIIAQCCY